MCLPVAAPVLLAIQTATAVAGAVFSHIGQQQAANAQEKAIKQGYNSQVSQLNEKNRQEQVKAGQEMSERARQAMFERARLRAASAEGGLGGISVDNIFSANEWALGQDLATMNENYRNTARQSVMEGTAMRAEAQSRLTSIERPSILNTGLQIASIGLDSAQQYSKLPKKP